MSKLLRTIRFDESDESVFSNAALEQEWAISCAFQFCDNQFEELDGKSRQAFTNGFLGLESFGYSTFGITANITKAALADTELLLAKHFFETYGAPSLQAAMEAAKQEIEFTAQLCEGVPLGTVFAVKREFTLEGRIKEGFHKVKLDDDTLHHGNIWEIQDD